MRHLELKPLYIDSIIHLKCCAKHCWSHSDQLATSVLQNCFGFHVHSIAPHNGSCIHNRTVTRYWVPASHDQPACVWVRHTFYERRERLQVHKVQRKLCGYVAIGRWCIIPWVYSHLRSLTVDCEGKQSQQAAAITLGHTQNSWDNLSSEEQLPWSTIKHWVYLTANEKAAAEALGYNETTWDNWSGTHPSPASMFMNWANLTACANGEGHCRVLCICG